MLFRSAVLALAAICLPCSGQSHKPDSASASHLINPGVVVVDLGGDKAAEKVGFRPGDLILGWSRGEDHGSINTPFDFTWVNVEQKPRGSVRLEGLRGANKRTWTISGCLCGLRTRPNFARASLRLYQRSEALTKLGKATEAVNVWESSLENKSLPRWFSSWLALHEAQLLYATNQPGVAQFVIRAIHQAPKKSRVVLGSAVQLVASNSPVTDDWARLNQEMESRPDLQERDESLVQAWIDEALGWGYLNQHDQERAEQHFLQSLAILSKQAPEAPDSGASLEGLGLLFLDRDDLEQAQLYLEKALRFYQKDPEQLEKDGIEIALASLETRLGEAGLAEQHARDSLARLKGRKWASYNIAADLEILGIVAEQRGDFLEAGRYLRQALAMQEKERGNPYNVASTLGNLGDLEADRGNFDAAAGYHRRALRLLRTYRDNSLIADELNHLGDAEHHAGKLRLAEHHLSLAYSIEGSLNPQSVDRAETLSALGGTSLARGDLDIAEKKYSDALRILEELKISASPKPECFAGLARVARRRGQLQRASDYFSKALAVLDDRTAHVGGDSTAVADFRAKHSGYYREYIDLLVEKHDLDGAFAAAERSRSRTLLETLANARVKIANGVDAALLSREQDLLRQIKAQSARHLGLLGRQHSQEELKAVQDHVGDLLAEYREVDGQIRSTSPSYAALIQPQPWTVTEIQREMLDSDTLLLEFSLGEERSHLFAVTATSLNEFRLPSRAVIEKQAQALYRAVRYPQTRVGVSRQNASKEPVRPDYLQTASVLSRMILEPAGSLLQHRRLLIVADGGLQYIPFAMLPEPSSAIPARRAPLVVHHEIVSMPSASVLAVLRDQQQGRPAPARAVAVLADPVFDKADPRVASAKTTPRKEPVMRLASLKNPEGTESQKTPQAVEKDPYAPTDSLTRSAVDVGLIRGGKAFLPRLRYSRQEAESIAAVAPKDQSFVAMDFDATRAAAMSPELSQYRIVHFATHGLLDSQHPELSGLVFSLVDKHGNPQDGFLTLQDIYNLNLPADLVVLSGCETGLGKEISGEGLVGLTRGFMYAGATRVIASLWKVSDAATAKLMAELYRGIETEGMRPAEALRAAQIKMWKEKRWSAPYYWAGFQIQGEWK